MDGAPREWAPLSGKRGAQGAGFPAGSGAQVDRTAVARARVAAVLERDVAAHPLPGGEPLAAAGKAPAPGLVGVGRGAALRTALGVPPALHGVLHHRVVAGV